MSREDMANKIQSLLAYAECDGELAQQCLALLDDGTDMGLLQSLL